MRDGGRGTLLQEGHWARVSEAETAKPHNSNALLKLRPMTHLPGSFLLHFPPRPFRFLAHTGKLCTWGLRGAVTAARFAR